MNQDTITYLIVGFTLAIFLLVLVQKIRAIRSGNSSCGGSCGCKIRKNSPPKTPKNS